jgi:hypothetical protein
MNKVNQLFCLAALLLAGLVVPYTKHTANAAILTQPSGISFTVPQVTADSLPVPWGKKPGGLSVRAPQALADSLPVPWGKKPGGIGAVAPQVLADSLPVPWGKKPGGMQS